VYTLEFPQRYPYESSHGISVPIRLRLGAKDVGLLAKIDTGAEYCIFEKAYGVQLGLVIESGEAKQFGTASGGSFRAFGHQMTMEVLGCSFDGIVYFAEDVGFSRNVLGRNGWLNKCRVAIVDHDQLLYLGEYDQ